MGRRRAPLPLRDLHGPTPPDRPRDKSVTIFDCLPPWHPNLTDWSRSPIAQLRHNPNNHAWTLYWADRNSRWHRYDDLAPGPIDDLLNEISNDPTSIFCG